jgi:flagellar basal-body rod protein FlgG
MIRSLWIAKTGLQAQQIQMDVIANNLANVSTNGFKRSRAVFEDLLYQNIQQAGSQSSQQTQLPTGLQLGTGVQPIATERLFTQGNLTQTSNNTDVAINGSGFFQVTLPSGQLAYTRDGSFQMNSQGQLVTANGYLLQPSITIPANAQNLTIGTDGTVSITVPNSTAVTTIGVIQVATFINPAGLSSIGHNLYSETNGSGNAILGKAGNNGTGVLSQGFVETSNVNVVEELVNMIQTQRAYEINSKAVTASDQMLQKLSQMSN